MSGSGEAVAVSILGKEYRISCEPGAEQELVGAARFLDARMREVRGSGKVIGTDRIAVMVALNLAHELLKENQIRIPLQARPTSASAHCVSVLKLRSTTALSWNSEAFGFSLYSDIPCGARQLARCSLEPMLMHPGTGSRLPVCKSAS